MSIISSERAGQIRGELCEKHGATWLHHYHEAIEAAILEHQASTSASLNRRISDHQRQRSELWMSVAVAVASSSNSTTKSSMTSWADHALNEFDRRFVAL